MSVNRVAKVVKGGRRFGFSALVVVGDGKGRVGYGSGKAREVPEAVRKATEQAKRGMIRVPLRQGRTLHHDIVGHFGAGRVLLRTAPPGTGIIAGGPMRAVCEALGIHDVVGKSLGSTNPHNMVKATFDALVHVVSPRLIAAKRGRKVAEILGRRDAGGRRRRRRSRAMVAKVKITQVKSPIARPDDQERTLVALGLNKLHRSRVVADTPAIAGGSTRSSTCSRVEPVDEQRVAADEAERTPRQSGRADQPQAARARHRLRPRQDVGQGPQGRQGAPQQPKPRYFEGGQMPIYRRVPKRGFKNPTRVEYAEVNIGRLQAAIEAGRLDAGKTIDAEALIAAGLVRRVAGGHPAAGSWRAQGGGDDRGRRRLQGCRGRGRAGGRQGRRAGRPGRSLSRPRGGGGTHGVGSRAARRQHQFRRLQQGDRAQEAALVHARLPDRLSARHLHPAAGHRPGR